MPAKAFTPSRYAPASPSPAWSRSISKAAAASLRSASCRSAARRPSPRSPRRCAGSPWTRRPPRRGRRSTSMAQASSAEPGGSGAAWKVTLPCTRAEAEALTEDIPQLAALDAPPVLMTSEADGDAWQLDAYFEAEPGSGDIALLLSLVPSAGGAAPRVERLADEDWVTLSQAGLEPIRAGRFFVHTPAHRDAAPPGAIAFEIDAGRAFGTGQHETTTGCLLALDRLRGAAINVANLADIGTGTGLLAFAAMRLWPAARAIASDVAPVAVAVAAENAAVNHTPIGRARGQLELAVAAGMDHPRL